MGSSAVEKQLRVENAELHKAQKAAMAEASNAKAKLAEADAVAAGKSVNANQGEVVVGGEDHEQNLKAARDKVAELRALDAKYAHVSQDNGTSVLERCS